MFYTPRSFPSPFLGQQQQQIQQKTIANTNVSTAALRGSLGASGSQNSFLKNFPPPLAPHLTQQNGNQQAPLLLGQQNKSMSAAKLPVPTSSPVSRCMSMRVSPRVVQTEKPSTFHCSGKVSRMTGTKIKIVNDNSHSVNSAADENSTVSAINGESSSASATENNSSSASSSACDSKSTNATKFESNAQNSVQAPVLSRAPFRPASRAPSLPPQPVNRWTLGSSNAVNNFNGNTGNQVSMVNGPSTNILYSARNSHNNSGTNNTYSSSLINTTTTVLGALPSDIPSVEPSGESKKDVIASNAPSARKDAPTTSNNVSSAKKNTMNLSGNKTFARMPNFLSPRGSMKATTNVSTPSTNIGLARTTIGKSRTNNAASFPFRFSASTSLSAVKTDASAKAKEDALCREEERRILEHGNKASKVCAHVDDLMGTLHRLHKEIAVYKATHIASKKEHFIKFFSETSTGLKLHCFQEWRRIFNERRLRTRIESVQNKIINEKDRHESTLSSREIQMRAELADRKKKYKAEQLALQNEIREKTKKISQMETNVKESNAALSTKRSLCTQILSLLKNVPLEPDRAVDTDVALNTAKDVCHDILSVIDPKYVPPIGTVPAYASNIVGEK